MNKHGSWIKEIGEEKNLNVLFANDFTFKSTQEITFKIIGLDLYKVFVDGKSVFFGPTRTAHGYCVENIFKTIVKKGTHTISILVSSYGVASYYVPKKKPCLCVDFSIDNKTYSEKDFRAFKYTQRVSNVQRFSFQRGFVEIYKQSKTFVDEVRNYIDNIKPIKLEKAETPEILNELFSLSPLSTTLKANLYSQGKFEIDSTLPKWRDRSLVNVGDKFEGFYEKELYENLTDFVNSLKFENYPFSIFSGGCYKLYDFKRNISGFIKIEFEVVKKADIYIIFDELLDDKGNIVPTRGTCANVIKLEYEPGKYIFESNEVNTLRFLNVICRGGEIKVKNVNLILVENSSVYNNKIHTFDRDLKAIYKAAQNTLAQNSYDLIMDCPSRERAGWINDLYFSKKPSELLSGDNKVVNQTLINFLLAPELKELPKGMIPMCYPSDHIDGNFIVNNSLWFVICLMEQLQKGELIEYKELIENKVKSIFKYFDNFKNEDGLIENLQGWVFVEWSIANDANYISGVNYPSNMLYYKALTLAGETLGNKKYVEEANSIKEKIIEQSFNGETFEDNRIRNKQGELIKTGHCSETCQYYAAFSGVANDDFINKLVNRSFSKKFDGESNIIPGLLMRLETLINYKQYKLALSEVKDIFSKMAEKSQTLWEHTGFYCSLNHGIASYAAVVIFKALEGIKNANN